MTAPRVRGVFPNECFHVLNMRFSCGHEIGVTYFGHDLKQRFSKDHVFWFHDLCVHDTLVYDGCGFKLGKHKSKFSDYCDV